MRERKARARVEARAARRAIAPHTRAEGSRQAAAHVLALPEVQAARAVACYVGVHSELATDGLLAALLARPVDVAVPVVEPPESMRFARLRGLDALAPGAHGIPEPRPPHDLVARVDVVVVPGLLFTPDGHRLGNGGGYFDRVLRAAPEASRVGLAFDAQVVDALPMETHDEPLDVLVTPTRVLRTRARGSS